MLDCDEARQKNLHAYSRLVHNIIVDVCEGLTLVFVVYWIPYTCRAWSWLPPALGTVEGVVEGVLWFLPKEPQILINPDNDLRACSENSADNQR